METWNRNELYAEVWEQPLTKLATKYGISNVMLGKICRKLQIPLPGRGYWAKKEFNKAPKQLPLPEAKNVPKQEVAHSQSSAPPVQPTPEPTDAEYLRIKEVESKPLTIRTGVRRHKLVVESERMLRNGRCDAKGLLEKSWKSLDLHVSKGALDRALSIMDTIITALEAHGFQVILKGAKHNTQAIIFGQDVGLGLVEKLREKSRREIRETPTWTRWEIEYEPTGELEFQIDHGWRAWKEKDSKKRRLEEILPKLLGALMREARGRIIQAEQARLAAIEEQKKAVERLQLQEEIEKEEKKLAQLQGWVTRWLRAGQMRQFIAALENAWKEQGQDLFPESKCGQRIAWMKQQADREDPLVFKPPPSILDRKGELRQW